ncbi:uncharacterized protein B0I36DRAFT_146450 [Microdochium trichocladiopsis]|uniref:Uncharacterized protein n=1 Tax=Microdochium trichocladiopsis TaxID=1682393 RepID=A0A9P8Y5M4_9PEZI|nr:uncharacterized protein B0I36DRAFT_146450 [Microdochium trichocladiopsis]KAH7028026.1 hypothetical protein B0I36DRAFT_146450 [Microdochium trichocladiopsis]
MYHACRTGQRRTSNQHKKNPPGSNPSPPPPICCSTSRSILAILFRTCAATRETTYICSALTFLMTRKKRGISRAEPDCAVRKEKSLCYYRHSVCSLLLPRPLRTPSSCHYRATFRLAISSTSPCTHKNAQRERKMNDFVSIHTRIQLPRPGGPTYPRPSQSARNTENVSTCAIP